MNTIVLNSNNIINSGNNQLRYRFPTANNFPSHQIALASIQLYYSWFNISSSNGNNVFQYRWFDNVVYTVNIPNGFYTIAQLSAYLQSVMISNTHYLISSTTRTNVYFLEFVTNATLYSCQINAYPLSQTLATSNNWTLPVNATWTIPGGASISTIIIGASNFTKILGINAGTYPVVANVSTSQAYSKTSDFCPSVSPVNSLMLSCSLINSPYGNPANILYSFAPDVTFGSLINNQVNEFSWVEIAQGNYTEILITIVDQNLNPVTIIDPSIVITLLIKKV